MPDDQKDALTLPTPADNPFDRLMQAGASSSSTAFPPTSPVVSTAKSTTLHIPPLTSPAVVPIPPSTASTSNTLSKGPATPKPPSSDAAKHGRPSALAASSPVSPQASTLPLVSHLSHSLSTSSLPASTLQSFVSHMEDQLLPSHSTLASSTSTALLAPAPTVVRSPPSTLSRPTSFNLTPTPFASPSPPPSP